jgi:hypothetical protein
MSSSYDHDALWLKAKLFLNLSLEEGDARTFDERALWASLALELLGKAALAKVSPLLIAVPTEEGVNVLIAAGLTSGEARFESIKAHSLFSRCARAFKPFSERQALAIARARNEYVHGGEANFSKLPPDAWWPRYWAQAVILVHAQDRDIEELVGYAASRDVERHLARNAKNVEHRTEMRIERARQRLAQHASGLLSAREAAEWARPVQLRAGLTYEIAATCPACGEQGTLEGENVSDHTINHEQISEEDFDSWVDILVDAEYFSCGKCRMVLDDYELLVQAGLVTEFSAIGDISDFVEHEYGND